MQLTRVRFQFVVSPYLFLEILNLRRPSMSFLPLEITEEIINVLAQDDPSFSSTKECALVCHEFYYLCRKHIFASINLNYTNALSDTTPNTRITRATTRMLQQLLDTTPEIADYIYKLSYNVTLDDLENGSLVETFRKITRLKSLSVCHVGVPGPRFQWNNNSLRPGLLHLLHLPTLISLKMLFIDNFPFSDLAPCINLEQWKFVYLTVLDDEISPSNLPKKSIRLRDISAGLKSASVIKKMCAVHCADGKPFIKFSCVNNLTIRLHRPNEVQASLDLLSRCKKLASITLVCDSMVNLTQIGVFKFLYPTMQTLKYLHMKTFFDEHTGSDDPLSGLCNVLDEMKNKNVIETITIGVFVKTDSDCRRGDEWGRLDAALAQPGWPKLRQVSLGIIIWSKERANDDLECALKELPQTQFPKLSSSKSLSFEFFVRGERV